MTARADGWTDVELQCLYDVVNDVHWFDQVAPLIDRSEAAIRTRMSNLRAEAGIVPSRAGARSRGRWAVTRDDAARGSDALLGAINAAAARRAESEAPAEPREEAQLAFLDGPLFDWRHAA